MSECFLHGHDGLPTKGLPEFTYTGQYKVTDEGNKNWNIQLLTSGDFNISKLKGATKGIEVCIVAGGQSGSRDHSDGGGKGGNGGAVRNETVIPVKKMTYGIIVGAGGEHSSAFGFTANAGEGASGGRGGYNEPWPNGQNGQDGTHAFNDTAYPRYGAGGGGGAGAWDSASGSPGTGGDYGGGNGGTNYNSPATAGFANTGGGGGGACWGMSYGAPGGSGIVIIRNKRN